LDFSEKYRRLPEDLDENNAPLCCQPPHENQTKSLLARKSPRLISDNLCIALGIRENF
jgi:hypothetical protein